MSVVVEFTQPYSYQSYFMKGRYTFTKNEDINGEDVLSLKIWY